MSASSIDTSFGDLATQLSPSNINQTIQNANDNKNKMVAMGTNTIQTLQVKTKKQYYQDTFNGDPSGNPPNPPMTIFGVFKSYVSYKTPDDSRQTPKGTVMDISHVVHGLLPTFQTLPDATFSPEQMSKSTMFVKKIITSPDLATAQQFIQKFGDSLESISKNGNAALQQEFETMKQSLEPYRQPMLDAMFAFDDPDLASQAGPAPAPAPKSSAPAPAPPPRPAPAPKSSATEGFSLMAATSATWISSDVGWILLSILGVLVFGIAWWTWTTGKSFLSLCRRCGRRKARTSSRRSRR